MNTKMINFAFSWIVLLTIGCASIEKQTEISKRQFSEVVDMIRSKKPRPILLAQIKRMENGASSSSINDPPTLSIRHEDKFITIFPSLGHLDYLNAIVVCGDQSDGVSAMNCLQFNNRHVGKISESDRKQLYSPMHSREQFSSFESEMEFNCIKKFSDKIPAIDHRSLDSVNEASFRNCISTVRFGVKEDEIQRENPEEGSERAQKIESFNNLNPSAPVIRARICLAADRPLMKDTSVEDYIQLVLFEAFNQKLPEMVNMRKVLKCN